eukprot:763932-Hanusia_phi.AAC.2
MLRSIPVSPATSLKLSTGTREPCSRIAASNFPPRVSRASDPCIAPFISRLCARRLSIARGSDFDSLNVAGRARSSSKLLREKRRSSIASSPSVARLAPGSDSGSSRRPISLISSNSATGRETAATTASSSFTLPASRMITSISPSTCWRGKRKDSSQAKSLLSETLFLRARVVGERGPLVQEDAHVAPGSEAEPHQVQRVSVLRLEREVVGGLALVVGRQEVAHNRSSAVLGRHHERRQPLAVEKVDRVQGAEEELCHVILPLPDGLKDRVLARHALAREFLRAHPRAHVQIPEGLRLALLLQLAPLLRVGNGGEREGGGG